MHGPDGVSLYTRLEQKRSNFDTRWEAMAPFISPSRIGVTTQRAPGEKQTLGVHDSTGMMAAEMSANFIAGSLLNQGQQWGAHRFQTPPGVDRDELLEWEDESRDRMLRAFADSMFYAEGAESITDWIGFGTGFCLMEELPSLPHEVRTGFRGFYVEAQKTGRFVINDGPTGMAETAGRSWSLSANAIRARWPNAQLPNNVQTALQKQEGETRFTVLHLITPRHVSEQRSYSGARGMKYASAWIEKASKQVLHESGYRRFPGAVFRHYRTPGESYGRGRGDLAYPDIASLNRAKRMGFEDWALKLRPPVLVANDSVFGTLNMVPGGDVVVNAHGRPLRDVIAPWETGSNPQLNAIKEEELRKSIRQIFLVDQLLMLMEVNKSEMTAFEFAKKMEILYTLMGPVYARVEREFLSQIWETAFDLMYHAGAFSPPPQAFYESGGEYQLIFENPLARSRRTSDVEAVTMAFNDLAPFAQLFPQVMDRFDPDGAAKHIFAVRGVPGVAQRSEAQIQAIREAKAEQEQQDLEMARMSEAAEGMKNVAPLMKVLQPQAKAA